MTAELYDLDTFLKQGVKRGRVKPSRDRVAELAAQGLPPHLAWRQRPRITEDLAAGLCEALYSPAEVQRVMAAMRAIPRDPREDWLRVGMALHWTRWPEARDIWDAWSKRSPKFTPEGQDKAWESFGDFLGEPVTTGWVFMRARECGFDEKAYEQRQAPQSKVETGPTQPVAVDGATFPVLSKGGKPSAGSATNVYTALQLLGVNCFYDEFHDRTVIAGEQYSDRVIVGLMRRIYLEFGWEPAKEAVHTAVTQFAQDHRCHPIREYLNGLKWDGTPRLDSWLIDYLGAPDAPLIRAMARIHLIAAVRRVRDPGCKYDYMLVLEGGEGVKKSWAIATLAGQENFSDNPILGEPAQRQQELLAGVWHYECSELEGLKKKEFADTKAFITRQWDRSRPAYERQRIDRPRQCVLYGTTNEDKYLPFEQGIRRFIGIPTNNIDIEGLAAARDQLYAEAAHAEAAGEAIVLPEKLRKVARQEQEARTHDEPWQDVLAQLTGELCVTEHNQQEYRIFTATCFTALNLQPNQQTTHSARVLARIMKRLGWQMTDRGKVHINGKEQRGYFRPPDDV